MPFACALPYLYPIDLPIILDGRYPLSRDNGALARDDREIMVVFFPTGFFPVELSANSLARVRHSAYDLVIDGSCPDQSRKGDPDHTACVESIVGSTMHSVILCHSLSFICWLFAYV